jgi:hypothetical protein
MSAALLRVTTAFSNWSVGAGRSAAVHRAGDPAKAAQILLKIVDSDDPPAHLLLGRDALTLVYERLAARSSEIKVWDFRFAVDLFQLIRQSNLLLYKR